MNMTDTNNGNPPKAKHKNPYRISLNQYCEENGIDDKMALLEELTFDSVCPALCKEGCEVEPDGTCPHGCPSILLAVGVI